MPKGFQKGHLGFKKPGTKHKETLLREERRAIFEAKISEKWEEIIDKLPPTYIADQYLGKAPEEHNIHMKEKVVDDSALDEASKLYGLTSTKRKTA